MDKATKYFFELIQVSIGTKECMEHLPTAKQWGVLLALGQKQSLAGILFEGMKKLLPTAEAKPSVFFEWFAIQQQTVMANKQQNQRAVELYQIFSKSGFRSCVLKGQGTALYYEHPEYRQCGDIDIWVEGDRDNILAFARRQGRKIGHVDIKHSDIEFFNDVPVEVHFLPSWMYNPMTNRKLQRFFREKAEGQFSNQDKPSVFIHTTIDFDLVYSMVHIYRHIFSEGIGLRQLMDYYYILQHSKKEQRQEAFVVLGSLKMSSFVGGIMWILVECFAMKNDYAISPVNERHGKFLLSEILTAGNFGQYDDRMKRIDHNKRFHRGIIQFKKNLRFVSYYPSEVLWSPFWKLWHWFWRKNKGYL